MFAPNTEMQGTNYGLRIGVPDEYKKDYQAEQRTIPRLPSFSYGTDGVRSHADYLVFIAFRMGYFAGLRARYLNKCVGVMITASHKGDSNGIKIVDPMGEMIPVEWQTHATKLINISDEYFPTAVRDVENEQFLKTHGEKKARVVCASDTDDVGDRLVKAVKKGAALLLPNERGVAVDKAGVLTSPQLHFVVRCKNDPDYGTASGDGYCEKISSAFNSFVEVTKMQFTSPLLLDCANGIGARAMRQLEESLMHDVLPIVYYHEDGELNDKCGVDFVMDEKVLPSEFDRVDTIEKCASFDGDAERLIYFRCEDKKDTRVSVLDGNRIAALFTEYLDNQLQLAGEEDELTLGVIQTIFANGASTTHIRDEIGVETVCRMEDDEESLRDMAKKFDIGVYFEQNGRGSVVFSDKFDTRIRETLSTDPAILSLRHFSNVINETTSDALANLLAVELVLRHNGDSIVELERLYTDLHAVKVSVSRPDEVEYLYLETELLDNHDLTRLIARSPAERAFVLYLESEKNFYVYVEALTQPVADQLVRDLLEFLSDTLKTQENACAAAFY